MSFWPFARKIMLALEQHKMLKTFLKKKKHINSNNLANFHQIINGYFLYCFQFKINYMDVEICEKLD